MEALQLKTLIENLRPRFEERRALSRQVENVKDYDRRKNQLKAVVEDIKSRLKQAELLKINYEFEAHIAILDMVKANTQTMLDKFSTDQGEILAVGDSWFDLWKQVGKELQEAINQSWILFKSQRLFHIDEFEFNLLDMFDEYKSIRKELVFLKARLDPLIQYAAPSEQATWDQIKALNEQIRQTWSKVSWAGLPKEVVTFITKAKGQGVAVADYDHTIQTWLQRHGLEKYFVIKVALRYG